MQIRIGYELIYECPQPTPMMFALHVHPSRPGRGTIAIASPDNK